MFERTMCIKSSDFNPCKGCIIHPELPQPPRVPAIQDIQPLVEYPTLSPASTNNLSSSLIEPQPRKFVPSHVLTDSSQAQAINSSFVVIKERH
ncbi:hypothetical protein DL95DRAFT_378014 [Leptodontidium sp. 2 PMI_412]|nr:hypothetical protein DL95DRAFT_378014 [Leptodontidium sp. 2 PMI_412]